MRSFLSLKKKQGAARSAGLSAAGGLDWEYGLHDPVHDDGVEAAFDIYFVHGLNGDRIETFTSTNSDGSKCFWPRDLLPQRLHDEGIKCRIYSYGYNARTNTGRISLQSFWDHGEELLKTIAEERELRGEQRRPIIFMSHSLGGLLVKCALHLSYLSSAADDPISRSVFLSTHSVFFFGVPHQGGHTTAVSLGKIALDIVGVARNTNKKIVEILEPDNQALEANFASYNKISHNFYQRTYWEKYFTTVKLLNMEVKDIWVVPKDSAIIPGMKNDQTMALDKDHLSLVRYSSAEDPGFRAVSRGIILEIRKGTRVVNERWANWDMELRQQRQQAGTRRIATNWPFAPNPRFKGRRDELTEMQQAFKDREDAQYVAICGQGGIGKTTLARQYCHESERMHSCILWIHSNTLRNAQDDCIWFLREIIKVQADDAPQRTPNYKIIARDLGIQGLLNSEGLLDIGDDPEKRATAVRSVVSWLTRQIDHSWLMVFDEVDSTDVPLKDFMPKCGWGFYLFTTRRPDIRDFAQIRLNLEGLSITEGVDLLLHGTRTDSQDMNETAKAEALVDLLDRHPLAIDQASAYLRKRPWISLDEYINIFRNKIVEIRPQELLARNENIWPDYNLTCMTTFEISLNSVQAECSNAPKLLRLCCWLDRDEISIPYLRAHSNSIGPQVSEHEIDEFVEILYAFSLIQPKHSSQSFSIHAVIHVWGRERLAITDRLEAMMGALNALIHSPYYSDGGGEIYQPAQVDYDLQRSAVRHLEYTLDVADEFIGFWNLRLSADSLNLSSKPLRTSIYAMMDAVFAQLTKFPDYPKPDSRRIRLSPVRPLKISADRGRPHVAFRRAIDQLRELWTILATVPGILLEQGRLQSSLRWQILVLPFLLTFGPEAFNAVMTPDNFENQVPISIIAIAVHLLRMGHLSAASRIVEFLSSKYSQHERIPNEVQGYATLLRKQISQALHHERPIVLEGEAEESDDESALDHILEVFKFERTPKYEGDVSEQINLRFESAELLARRMLEKEDFRAADIFREIRQKRREGLPNGQVNYYQSCVTLGNTLRLKGAIENNVDDMIEAISTLKEAVEGLTNLLGDKDHRVVSCMVILGSAYGYKGDLALSEQCLSGALIRYQLIQDTTLRDKVDCLEKLAETRMELKKYGMGEYGHFLCWDYRIRLLQLDPDHPATIRALIGWGKSLCKKGSTRLGFLLMIYALERKHACGQFDRSTQEALGQVLRVVSDFEGSGSSERKETRKISLLSFRYAADLLQSVNKKGLQMPLGHQTHQSSEAERSV